MRKEHPQKMCPNHMAACEHSPSGRHTAVAKAPFVLPEHTVGATQRNLILVRPGFDENRWEDITGGNDNERDAGKLWAPFWAVPESVLARDVEES